MLLYFTVGAVFDIIHKLCDIACSLLFFVYFISSI